MALQLVSAHVGNDNWPYLYWTTYDGTAWTADTLFSNGAMSDYGPALAVFDGLLYCVHAGTEGQTGLWWSTFNVVNGQWSDSQSFTNGNETSAGPALCVFQGVLYCVHMGAYDNYLWYCAFDPASQTWSADSPFTQNNETSCQPALVNVLDQAMYCVHKGNQDDNLWWCEFTGSDWTADTQFECGNQTSGPPALARYNEQTVCVHSSADGDQIQWSIFDGTSWGPDTTVPGVYTSTSPTAAAFNGALVVMHVAGARSPVAIAAQAEEEAKNDSRPAPFGGVQQAIENAGVEDNTPPILCYFWIAGDLTGPWSTDAALGPGNHAASSAALAVIDFP